MTAELKPGVDPWDRLANVPCELSLELEVPEVKVGDLLKLANGTVLNTKWRTNRDLPLKVNGRLLASVEFDGTGKNLSVRLTEFAWEQRQ